MARIRRNFVGSVVIDATLTSYVLLAALLHAVNRHTEKRPEMAPSIGHLMHAFIALFGLGAIWLPSASFFARSLRIIAVIALFGDAGAFTMHVLNLEAASMLNDECLVYAFLAILLFSSSINVYWRSTAELETLNSAAADLRSQYHHNRRNK